MSLILLLVCLLLSSCLGFDPIRTRYPDVRERVLAFASQIQKDRPGTLYAGTAKAEITPPVGTPLGGFARRRGKPSQGIHDPVVVRALALRDRRDLIFLVSCDLIGINEPFFDEVYNRVRQKHKIGREDILLFATHTHSGPGAIAQGILGQAVLGKFNRHLFNQMTAKVAETMLEASKKMKRVKVHRGKFELRDWIENRMIDEGPVDSEVQWIRLDDRHGGPKALLVNLAAHPTILSARNMLISADYPGFLQRKIEEIHPGITCLFANGAGGDLRIKAHHEFKDFERAQKVGEGLAEEVLKHWNDSEEIAKLEISTLGGRLPLPPVKIRLGPITVPRWGGRLLMDQTSYFEMVRLGDILLVGIPGELSNEIGWEIKAEARRRGAEALIIGYANDYLGYVIPERYYHTRHYEARASFHGKKMDSYLKEIVFTQMDLVAPLQQSPPLQKGE